MISFAEHHRRPNPALQQSAENTCEAVAKRSSARTEPPISGLDFWRTGTDHRQRLHPRIASEALQASSGAGRPLPSSCRSKRRAPQARFRPRLRACSRPQWAPVEPDSSGRRTRRLAAYPRVLPEKTPASTRGVLAGQLRPQCLAAGHQRRCESTVFSEDSSSDQGSRITSPR